MPTNFQEHLEKKYGKGAGSRMAVALDRAGQATGINFNNDRRVHNTIKSHRLVRLADEQGKGGDMIDQLFHGYFEEGRNIADVGVLLELAQKVGVSLCLKFSEQLFPRCLFAAFRHVRLVRFSHLLGAVQLPATAYVAKTMTAV